MHVDLSDILYDDHFNTRGFIPPHTVEELARSIQTSGMIQPVVVRPWTGPPYHLVCGHRRFLAVKSLGHEQIECVVRDLSDREAYAANLQENLARADLTPSQELDAIIRLYGDAPDTKQVATELGRSRKWVNERLAIRKLDPRVRADADAGLLSAYDISCLIVTPQHQQYALAQKLKDAHARGKGTVSVMEGIKGAKRRVRAKAEILKMISTLMESGFEPRGYRCLAWAAGTIGDDELLNKEDRRKRC